MSSAYAAARLRGWVDYTPVEPLFPAIVGVAVPLPPLPDAPFLADIAAAPDATCSFSPDTGKRAALARTMARLAPIGASQPAAWVNPASATPLVRTADGNVYPRGAAPPIPAVSEEEMLAQAQSTVGGVRAVGNGQRGGFSPGTPPPRMIAPSELGRWPAPRNCFPVYVTYPGFGAGLAVRFMGVTTSIGFGDASLYYAVKKFTPLGPVPTEPFSLGIYAVPAWMVTRLPLAVAQLFPAENVAVIDDSRGEQFSITFVDLRSSKDPRYEVARRLLLLQYPYLLTDMFATRLLSEPPVDMLPGGSVPAVLANLPPLLVPKPT